MRRRGLPCGADYRFSLLVVRPVLKHAEFSSRESMPACHLGIALNRGFFQVVQGRIFFYL